MGAEIAPIPTCAHATHTTCIHYRYLKRFIWNASWKPQLCYHLRLDRVVGIAHATARAVSWAGMVCDLSYPGTG